MNRPPRGRKKAKPAETGKQESPKQVKPLGLRIVGGAFRGRKLIYHGDQTVRPMKDRTREAIFNLLGPAVKETQALDLFAGTGALGLEALSRGATRATFIERHYPTVHTLRDNVRLLGVEDRAEVLVGDSFFWFRQSWQFPREQPITLFVSPPYVLFQTQCDDLMAMVARAQAEAAPGSLIVVEADESFAAERLPNFEQWDVRDYPPARVGLFRVPDPEELDAADETPQG